MYVYLFIIGILAIIYFLLKDRLDYLQAYHPANVEYPSISIAGHSQNNYLIYIIIGIGIIGFLVWKGHIKVK